MSEKWFVLAAALVISGCSAPPTVREFNQSDGTVLKIVQCTRDRTICVNVAAQSCPPIGTYQMLSSESHAGGSVSDMLPGPVVWYGMTYACGPADARLPDFPFSGPQYVPSAVIIASPPIQNTDRRLR